MQGLIRVRDSFVITGRGPVLAAEILGGAVRIGMQIELTGRPEALVISQVEYVDWRSGDASIGLLFHDALSLEDLRSGFPPGSEVVVRERADARGAPMAHLPLRRFWFPLTRGFGIGVTAPSEEAAQELAERTRALLFADAKFTGIVPDIDVSTLDAGHVLPNLGISAAPGVWFPAIGK